MFNGNPAASKAFHAGQFHVQGLASQFAALCCDARPGMRVLDLCAAPGGKSLTIAEQMQNRGELFSGEAMTGRVKLLKQAFDRCGIERAKPYHGDATILNPAFGLGSFDRVLCDVPCSGLGVIGKKPDIREKTLDGIENLLLTQQKILQNGAKYLAPNGRLVYSTCTVNHHENEAQVRQFLQDNQDFSVIAPQIILSGMRVGEYGTLFLPHETSTDGFFCRYFGAPKELLTQIHKSSIQKLEKRYIIIGGKAPHAASTYAATERTPGRNQKKMSDGPDAAQADGLH